ncbi:hypothetical protein ES702_03929 [subsurface metagenome]
MQRSNRLLGMWLLLFMLIFLFPSFNTQVHLIGENVNATNIEVILMDITPTILIVGVVAYAILLTSYTIKMVD